MLVEAYAKAQGMWRGADAEDPVFTDTLALDLGTVVPSSPVEASQDQVLLSDAKTSFADTEDDVRDRRPVLAGGRRGLDPGRRRGGDHPRSELPHLQRLRADRRGARGEEGQCIGFDGEPWVRTSLAPGAGRHRLSGSRRATSELDALGNLVGYGCTTCIGNSGPLDEPIGNAIDAADLVVCSVLSGNRSRGPGKPACEGELPGLPPLVVAYAIAGTMTKDLNDPLGEDADGNPVFLKDIWPSNKEIDDVLKANLSREMFRSRYANVFDGTEEWQAVQVEGSLTYGWNAGSTYVQEPPYFIMEKEPAGLADIVGARPLALLADSITTDHISPADRSSATARRGIFSSGRSARSTSTASAHARQPQVMMRGTFANIRLANEMVEIVAGDYTPPALGRANVDLPRLDALPDGRRAAHRGRRQGVRHRLIPGLGPKGLGCWASRRSSSKALSASTDPISSGWACCRSSSPVRHPEDARAQRDRDLRHHWYCGRNHAADGCELYDPLRRRQLEGHHAALPDRYGRWGGLLPARHPAVCAADAGGLRTVRSGPRFDAGRFRSSKTSRSGLSPGSIVWGPITDAVDQVNGLNPQWI